jgi:hypothetical protein
MDRWHQVVTRTRTALRALVGRASVSRAAEDQARAAALAELADVSRWLRVWQPPPAPAARATRVVVPGTCFACYSWLACTGDCGGCPRPPRFTDLPTVAQPPEFADGGLDEGCA